MRDSFGYKLYYYGGSLDQSGSGVVLAISGDEINWQRDTENPVLVKESPYLQAYIL